MSKPLKYSLFLLVLGLIAGGLLALVNSFTEPKIEKRKEEAARAKLVELLPEYEFNTVTDEYSDLIDASTKSRILDIYIGINDDNKKIVVYKASSYGYAGDIVNYIAIDINSSEFVLVRAIEANDETAAIGKKVLDVDFTKFYSDTTAYKYNEVLEQAKKGILAGATFSTKGVLNAADYSVTHFVKNKDKLNEMEVTK